MNQALLPRFFLWFFLLMMVSANLHGQKVEGVVTDAETGQPLPFVAVVYAPETNLSTQTDARGRFSIPEREKITEVRFALMGYKTLTLGAGEIPASAFWNIRLEPQPELLAEIEVKPGENPALRMVRNVIAAKEKNNPKKLDTYYYRSYNKNRIQHRIDADSALTGKAKKRFEASKERYLMMLESITEKYYRAPNRSTERVLANRISGFKEPIAAMVPDEVQIFGFYDEFFQMVKKQFTNPIADNGPRHYDYILTDTISIGADTIFAIQFQPQKNAGIEALRGVMHVVSGDWAIVYVKAEMADKGKLNVALEQFYEKLPSGHWFPRRLNFELDLEQFPLWKTGATMVGSSILDSIAVNIELPEDAIALEEIIMDKENVILDRKAWDTLRLANLTQKEMATYTHMDSIGQRYKFDAAAKSTRHANRGFWAVGPINIEGKRFLARNDIEGLRTGIGLYNNELVSKWLTVGGYVGYGSLDMEWKYGLHADILFDKKNEVRLNFDYVNDLTNPGGTAINYWERPNFANQFFNTLMDEIESFSTRFDFRAFTYSTFKIGFRQFSINTPYPYTFTPLSENTNGTPFRFSEITFSWRWLYKERFASNYGQRITRGSKYPVVHLVYHRGLEGVFEADLGYNKVELGVLWDYFTTGLGRTIASAEFGYVDRPVPFSLNFSSRPSYNPSLSIVLRNTFQTMRFNEFSAGAHATLFFMHDFQTLLFKTKSKIFKPEVRLFHAMMFGGLEQRELHRGIPEFEVPRHGFFESGLVLDQLLRFNIRNSGYMGFGLGGFARYGAYAFDEFWDNWALKFSIKFSVN